MRGGADSSSAGRPRRTPLAARLRRSTWPARFGSACGAQRIAVGRQLQRAEAQHRDGRALVAGDAIAAARHRIAAARCVVHADHRAVLGREHGVAAVRIPHVGSRSATSRRRRARSAASRSPCRSRTPSTAFVPTGNSQASTRLASIDVPGGSWIQRRLRVPSDHSGYCGANAITPVDTRVRAGHEQPGLAAGAGAAARRACGAPPRRSVGARRWPA